MKKVATRFAPSPTGPLHIGGVRTALFNWLYSKNQKGDFYLRIEDTDKERSKDEYKDQIIKSLKWIGVEHDGDEYIQSKKINDHVKIANELLKNGYAYRCYCSPEEIEEQKKRAKQKKIPYTYNRRWRDGNEADAPKDIKPVIRFKSKIEGSSILKDLVQGDVEIDNITIEDFIILRNDGTPTYNLSASVDDHQMNMTHIIRGDDHKINTFKQIQIYEAMKWDIPSFAHIPLIHTLAGKKLSKRDNASTLDDYSKIGIMPEALRNYLLRLGWSYKDKEIFTLEESIKHFNLEGIGKSPSKLDMSRILSINEHYIKNMDESDLFNQFIEYSKLFKSEIKADKKDKIKKSLTFLKNKAKTLEDIFSNGQYIIVDKVIFNQEDIKLIDNKAKKIISEFSNNISKIEELSKENLEPIINHLIKSNETNFKGVGQPLRVVLTGSKFGPGIYDIINSLGKDEVLIRLKNKIILKAF
jgi:glutamyl-tRNA synthetase